MLEQMSDYETFVVLLLQLAKRRYFSSPRGEEIRVC